MFDFEFLYCKWKFFPSIPSPFILKIHWRLNYFNKTFLTSFCVFLQWYLKFFHYNISLICPLCILMFKYLLEVASLHSSIKIQNLFPVLFDLFMNSFKLSWTRLDFTFDVVVWTTVLRLLLQLSHLFWIQVTHCFHWLKGKFVIHSKFKRESSYNSA